MVLKHSCFNIRRKSEHITVIACCNVAKAIFAPSSNIQGRQQDTGVRRWLTPRLRSTHEPEIVVH